MIMRAAVAAVFLLLCSAECQAQGAMAVPQAWLNAFVGLAADPTSFEAPPPDLTHLVPLTPLVNETCPWLLGIAPDHPAFLRDATVSFGGPANDCNAGRLALATFSLDLRTPTLETLVAALTARLNVKPVEAAVGGYHELRWQISPSRAVVIQIGESNQVTLMLAQQLVKRR